MSKVYVTQVPNRKDPATNSFVPSVNIAPAAEHGELVIMMPSFAPFHATADLVKQLKEKLKDYNYEDGDSIVALGDPAIIAVAFAILGKQFGRFTILKWDRMVGRYLPSTISI